MSKLAFIGTLLILAGIAVLALTFAPVAIQEFNYRFRPPPSSYQVALTPQEADQLVNDPTLRDVVIIPQSFDFSLIIPKIGVNSVVFPNIDSGNAEVYLPVLKQGVAHALGSALPNQSGPIFIFAHSTDAFYNISRYNAVFFLLNKLTAGDDAYVFYQHRQYRYQVTDKLIVDPDAVPGLVLNAPNGTLILQTCYPPGTTSKRLLVLAKSA